MRISTRPIASTWPRTLRGWILLPDTRIQRADTTLDAIAFGLRDTERSMRGILNGIRQMVVGRIDARKHLGGPLTIMNIAYTIADWDAEKDAYLAEIKRRGLKLTGGADVLDPDGFRVQFGGYKQ